MASNESWRGIVATALNWEQAHATIGGAIDGLAPELRGRRPDNFPHSCWELLEHIRRTQFDLLDFMRHPDYKGIKWPNYYCQKQPARKNDGEWNDAVAQIHHDANALADFT